MLPTLPCALLVMVLSVVAGVGGGTNALAGPTTGPVIARVAEMPNLPSPLALRDWNQVTRDYLDLVFDFERQGDHLPLIRWQDKDHSRIWMPAYVGAREGTESINFLGAVVGGSLAGLDMRHYRGHDWVAQSTNWFNPADGIVLDWPEGVSGGSFWYDVLPNVLFYQIADLYPGDPGREAVMATIAGQWYRACMALGGGANPPTLPNFNHTAFNLRAGRPFDNGERVEPEGGAGIAWCEYLAWHRFHDPRFLVAADWALRALEQRPRSANPLYEVLLPYGAAVAARMNAELGRDYDVSKLVNWCFEAQPAPQARPHWGVITGRWEGMDVHGLVGSVTDGGGYAFAMNTFQYAGALLPLARYDPRYAHDLGKWVLNLANAARLFYPNAHDAAHQSSYVWSSAHDPKSAIAYEGLRRWKRGASVARNSRTLYGRNLSGNVRSTHFYREVPSEAEVLEETHTPGAARLEHIWEFDLPDCTQRFLVLAAERQAGSSNQNAFQFSIASNPDGPFTNVFRISDREKPGVVELSSLLKGSLYLKVESTDSATARPADRLSVDALAIAYTSSVSPYAQGDLVVAFVDLLKDSTFPIVLYRPSSVITDLGLYGSSHVGILGGIVHFTDVEGILQLDLLRTDYFHRRAYPSWLLYNPHPAEKQVKFTVGAEPRDVYDAVAKEFVCRGVRGVARVTIPADTARVLVVSPAGGRRSLQGSQLSVDGVVVDYRHPGL